MDSSLRRLQLLECRTNRTHVIGKLRLSVNDHPAITHKLSGVHLLLWIILIDQVVGRNRLVVVFDKLFQKPTRNLLTSTTDATQPRSIIWRIIGEVREMENQWGETWVGDRRCGINVTGDIKMTSRMGIGGGCVSCGGWG